jgi:hypothetical protein
LQAPARTHRLPPTKRVADIIRNNKEHIMMEWLKVTKSHPEFQPTSVSDGERLDPSAKEAG